MQHVPIHICFVILMREWWSKAKQLKFGALASDACLSMNMQVICGDSQCLVLHGSLVSVANNVLCCMSL